MTLQPLTAWPRGDFTADQVLAALDPETAPRVRHGAEVVDRNGVPTGAPLNFVTADVAWAYRPPDTLAGSTTQVADVRLTATLVVRGGNREHLGRSRYRLWTEWQAPDGRWPRFYKGAYVAARPSAADDGRFVQHTLKLADDTWTWNNTQPLDQPVSFDVGTEPVAWIIQDLAATYGVVVHAISGNTLVLDRPITFDAGTSRLAVYNSLLQAVGFDDLYCDERGRPTSGPLADPLAGGAEVSYGPGQAKIMPAGNVEPLLPSLPNVVVFVARQGPGLVEEGNGQRTVENQWTGPASLDALGGTRNVLRVEVDATDQAAIDAVARSQAPRYFAGGGLRFSGQVVLNPRHSDRDIIRLDKARLGLDGDWTLTSWTYPLHPGMNDPSAAVMAVTAEQRIKVGA